MKKLFLTLAIALGSLVTANAQEVGQWWVGGSVGAWGTKAKGSDAVWSANIMPEFGYVIGENLGLGVRLGYSHSAIDSDLLEANPLLGNARVNSYSISPFLRMSFLKGDMGALFVDAGVGYAYGKITGVKDAENRFEVGFRPGVAVNVSDRIALTGKFGFAGYQYAKQGDYNTSAFGLNLDMSQFLVGASVIF